MPQSFLRIVPYSGRAGTRITLSLVNFILLSGPFFCPLPMACGSLAAGRIGPVSMNLYVGTVDKKPPRVRAPARIEPHFL